jgi:type 1 glutamine amidotransferase
VFLSQPVGFSCFEFHSDFGIRASGFATLVCLALVGAHFGLAAADPDSRLRVLILDGQNNHDWQVTTETLRSTLLKSGRFAVDVATRPPYETASEGFDTWNPSLTGHQVLINNYNGAEWPRAMKTAFVRFVSEGGGVVNVHAANNAFTAWDDFNTMLGIGWRPASFGARLAVDDTTGQSQIVPPGTEFGKGTNSGHGIMHRFVVKARQPGHPILEGLPVEWLHGRDELYHGQRGSVSNLNVLASAFSDDSLGGSGRHEPVLWWVPFGKGRVVTTSLGHAWRGDDNYDSLYCVGFQTLVARSVEWAATGKVTIQAPAAFPSRERVLVVKPDEVLWPGR